MKARPLILITNDDGINAAGLHYLWSALNKKFDLVICAPASEQSGVGLSITTRDPLRVNKVSWADATPAWAITGTPTDCIKLALHNLLPTPPDLIVSGINRGSNAGRNVLYSGTVAGVIEGAIRDIPGIAFSCVDYFDTDYSHATAYIPTLVSYLLENPLASGSILNVNFPSLEHATPKGLKLTRQGKEYWIEDPDERLHPAERNTYYWLGCKVARFDEHEESDIRWLNEGYATAVPLQVSDLTDTDILRQRKKAFDALMTRAASQSGQGDEATTPGTFPEYSTPLQDG